MSKTAWKNEGHKHHLCFLQNVGMVEGDLEGYRKKVNEPKFLCRKCGRLANEATSLCYPEKL